MSSLVQLTEGTVFAGDFRVVRPLSAGGMGAVYVVEQVSTGMQRALKLMHPQLVTDPALRRRFEQEARVGSQIDSEHVVQVLAAGVDPQSGMPWLVMELLKGEDLAGFVARCGPAAPSMVRQIFDQLCHALGAAHASGIVHRDLKPENIYLLQAKRAGVQFMVKVLDFGIAKIVADAKKTETAALGSPMWMSPEQTARGHQISPASDVWALGLIGFHLLTGRYYWRSAEDHQATLTNLLREIVLDTMAPPSQRAAELGCAGRLPAGFDQWFERCCARDPRARFQSAIEANAELQRVLANAPDPSQQTAPFNAALAPTGYAATGGALGPTNTPAYGPPPQAQRPPTPPYGPPPSQALGPTQTPAYGPPPGMGGTPAYGPPGGPPPNLNPATAYAPAPPPQPFIQGGTPAHPPEGMYGPGTPVAGSYTNPRPEYGPPGGAPIAAQQIPPPAKSSAGLVLGILGAIVVLGGGGIAAFVFLAKPSESKPGQPGSAVVASAPASSVPAAASAASAAPSDDVTGKMTPIPGGTFQMGSKDEDDEKPMHEVKLPGFEIDTTEVTVAAWKACEKAGTCRAAPTTLELDGLSDAYKKAAKYCTGGRADRLDHPINCVEWTDAVAFCGWAGKRLPTEAEWEYAARMTKAGTAEPRAYPWGKPAPDAMLLNACGSECVAMLKREELLVAGQSTDPMFKADDQFPTTAPVGSFPKGATDLGIQDMSGNVSEWTADWYAATYLPTGASPATGSKRVNRGGSWDDQDAHSMRTTARAKDPPATRDVIIGFRCARGGSSDVTGK